MTFPFPETVGAISTQREGGGSSAPYKSFNLGDHVGDTPDHVQQNRRALIEQVGVRHVQWLQQVHGDTVLVNPCSSDSLVADAIYINEPGIAGAVMTADCLPVMLSNTDGSEVAILHCGWRGLVSPLMSKVFSLFKAPADEILAWLGPAIGPCHFEVGNEVVEQLFASEGVTSKSWYENNSADKAMVNLAKVAQEKLRYFGVRSIEQSNRCTYCDSQHYYSYRRDGVTGRMASLIWIKV